MQNFALLTEVGKSDRPVLLKRGMSATVTDLLMCAEYILSQGNANVVLCERGIKGFDPATRNVFDVAAVPLVRTLSHLPIIVDPSHATGRPDLIPACAMAGLAAGADGVHIEVHDCPEVAKSDGPQALLPEQYDELMSQMRQLAQVLRKNDFPFAGEAGLSRRQLIAGNWKMNTRGASAAALAKGVVAAVGGEPAVDIVLCPPLVYLSVVADAIAGTPIGLGAQNLYAADDGAFTGEINAGMLSDVGCRYVILGHSERRALMGETDQQVSEKLQRAMAGNLIPIVCVGETLEDREAGRTEKVVGTQLRGSLEGLDEARAASIVVAYEPVWAIGTGRTATPEQAEEVHAFIRKLLGELFTPEVADQIRIQYGGSVKPGNAKELLGQPNIDGALVGGASLKTEDFLGIIQAG